MALENTVIQDKLTAAFGANVLQFQARKDISFEIPADKITAIVLFKK
jgi:NADH-quinone oxidoreductase subunit C